MFCYIRIVEKEGNAKDVSRMQSVASTTLGDDVRLRLHAQGLMIILKDCEVDAANKEAIQLFQWMRWHRFCIRALMSCMRTTYAWDHVIAMRKTITPYLSNGRVFEVAAQKAYTNMWSGGVA